ncbi:Calcium-channel protein cch1 [Wickerhamiella sorbophila]|uniref:Calcium-channel protein CCH1 n=1 Tax=Wickerhamiella sorbophila TaxID=45607 RepID=A0A2T0FP10_9ASCO|nr:Calcium-channel protein cch1 [Wickerhamiella sorbophila]PRT56720.1 Calcium-channel protein cch1 [Wickerhamiella sorbophila]
MNYEPPLDRLNGSQEPGPSARFSDNISLRTLSPRRNSVLHQDASPFQRSGGNRLSALSAPEFSTSHSTSSGILAVASATDDKLDSWLPDELPNDENQSSTDDGSSDEEPNYRAGFPSPSSARRIANRASELGVLESPVTPKRVHYPSFISRRQDFEDELDHDRTSEPQFPTDDPFNLQPGAALGAENMSIRTARSYASTTEVFSEEKLYPNVPYGRTLFLFGTNHWLRKFTFALYSNWYMRYVVDALTFAQMIVLAIETANYKLVDGNLHVLPIKDTWETWVYFILYIIYTMAMGFQMIAYGAFTVQIVDRRDIVYFIKSRMRIVGSWLMVVQKPDNKNLSVDIEQRCFFRKSWNRLEFISVVCFWISFFTSIFRDSPPSHLLMIIAGIGQLRILRLLDIFAGTKIVLDALKLSIPLLRDALSFLAYFWIVYAIAGLRSFNSSLSRQCVWINTSDANDTYESGQFCGGYYDPLTGEILPALDYYGRPAARAKGYTCPPHSVCKSVENPESGTLSFDNIFNSLEVVFIIMSQNTYSDIMYDIIDAEYMVSSVFFITGVLVLNLWLINLLVAIMATSFDLVKGKLSGYRSRLWKTPNAEHSKVFTSTKKGRAYLFCQPLFLLLIVLDVVFQAIWGGLWAPDNRRLDFLYSFEIATTVALAIDIIFRFFVYFPRWREFFYSMINLVDAFLAVFTLIILAFHNDKTVYGFFGFFQLLRFYRIIGFFKVAREMWSMVLGNYITICFLALFYFATVFFASLIAAKIFQGSLPYTSDDEVAYVSFFDLSNSFIGMYQISTTENWTDVLFYVTANINGTVASACSAAFFCLWLFFSSFILMNMFVAVMTDNIVSRVKNLRKRQVEWFVNRYVTDRRDKWRSELGAGILALIRKTIGIITASKPHTQKISVTNDELQQKIIAEFLASSNEKADEDEPATEVGLFGTTNIVFSPLITLWKTIVKFLSRHPEGYKEQIPNRGGYHGSSDPDLYVSEAFTMRARTETFMVEYGDITPGFDRTLWIFGRHNKLRLFCQRIYPCAHGVRASGVEPSKYTWYPLSVFLTAAIIVMVVFSCINTPIYQLVHSAEIGTSTRSFTWFVYTDIVFLAIFLMEFLIKIVADGFHYTPNAYTHSVWNVIDLLVLISMTVTIGIELSHGPSRYSRGIMALRALRLLSMNPRSEEVFRSVFFSGLQQLLVASFIALGIIFPMSVWAKNMFSDRLKSCNDGNVENFSNCVDEYLSSPYAWDVWAPRAVSNPYFDFDTFGHALFITFGVLTLEGWVDVLNSVTGITEIDMNPVTFYRRYNALYPILWNFVGTVIIMTMIIAIIVRNYTFAKGTAFMTKDQLSWKYALGKFKTLDPLLKLPYWKPGSLRFKVTLLARGHGSLCEALQLWCLIVLTVTMCIFHAPLELSILTAYFILVIITSFMFTALEAIKLWANGWDAFRRAYWQWYAFLMPLILMIVTCFYQAPTSTVSDLQSGFLVLVLTLWIPRVKQLRTLLGMATANIWDICTLLQTWFVLYLTWAIALNQVFGLTRIGPNSSSAQNFRTVPKALILLARMSSGEGWNQILTDYLVSSPYCVQNPGFYETDCGDKTMAYILFISWNITSMYIFANLFISLIYETFWPVFHRAVSRIPDESVAQFQAAWQIYDPKATGYIPLDKFNLFLGSVEGYYKLGIYSDDRAYSVSAILNRSGARLSLINPYVVDIKALNQELAALPVDYFKRKREKYNLLCAQMKFLSTTDNSISFYKTLKTIPLYQNFDPFKSLSLKQYLKLRLVLHEVKRIMAAEVIQKRWRLHAEFKTASANRLSK